MLPLAKPSRRQVETPPANILMLQQHYSITEIAEKWNMSHDFVLQKFQDEPGVVRTQGKKGHIRVPSSVLERVYTELISAGTAR